MKFRIDGYDYNEWVWPTDQPLEKLHLRKCDEESVQIFLGDRVMGALRSQYFLEVFNQGRGYEFIEEWKNRHHIAMRKLTGAQILRITELLRSYGHSGGKI